MRSHEQVRWFLVFILMNVEDSVQLISEHCEVVNARVGYKERALELLGGEYLAEAQGPWQNLDVRQSSNCIYEFFVSDEIVFFEILLLITSV